jgi:hypothetical protein
MIIARVKHPRKRNRGSLLPVFMVDVLVVVVVTVPNILNRLPWTVVVVVAVVVLTFIMTMTLMMRIMMKRITMRRMRMRMRMMTRRRRRRRRSRRRWWMEY